MVMPTELAYDCINGVAQPYLPLPEPFTAHYRLTLLEETDLSTITKILSQSLVAQFLRNVPQPYTIQDAQEWYKSQPSNVHFHNFKYRSEEEKKLLLCFRFPFSVIRSKENDELVGYLSIRRNEWEWMEGISPTERKKLRKENDAKIAGDKSISYSIGEVLEPLLDESCS